MFDDMSDNYFLTIRQLIFCGGLLVACSSTGTKPADVTTPEIEAPPEDVIPEPETSDAEPEDPGPAPLPTLTDAVTSTISGVDGTAIQPAVAIDHDGTLAIAYTSKKTAESAELGTWLQIGDEAPVALFGDGEGHNEPAICALGDGFVVVWSISNVDGAGGLAIGVRTPGSNQQSLVETEVEGNHWLADVACSGDEYAIAGVRPDPDGTFGVFFQRYDPSGKPLSAAVTVSQAEDGNESQPVIAMAGDDLVVAWDRDNSVFARSVEGTVSLSDAVEIHGDGVPAGNAAVAVDEASGTFVVGATMVQNVVLHAIGGPTPEIPGAPPRMLPAMAFANAETLAVIWLQGTGTATEAVLALGSELVVLGPVGSAPYFPSVAYRDGVLTAAWTRRTPDGFVIDTATF